MHTTKRVRAVVLGLILLLLVIVGVIVTLTCVKITVHHDRASRPSFNFEN
jgi:hypothetical protein